MQAELRRLHSPDVELETFQPEEPHHFGFLIQALIGPKGGPREESFDIVVCTPQWLAEKVSRSKYLWGRHYLFMHYYSFNFLQEAIAQICREAQGPDWHTVANRLQQYAHWEFDSYAEDSRS